MKKYLPISTNKTPVKVLADYAPLTLSMVGDSVHTLFLRTYFLEKDPYKNSLLHKDVSEYACATSQAQDGKVMLQFLSDDERRIFNKAKNCKINTVPKHASYYEYQLATAFEAVCGYLYLSGQDERLAELFDEIYREKLPKIENKVD